MRGARRWVISSSTPPLRRFRISTPFLSLKPPKLLSKSFSLSYYDYSLNSSHTKILIHGFFETFPVFIKFFFHRFLIVLSGLSPNWGKYKSSIFNFYHINIIIVYTMLVCLFVSNKRQNGYTDRAQILCGTSRDSREGL